MGLVVISDIKTRNEWVVFQLLCRQLLSQILDWFVALWVELMYIVCSSVGSTPVHHRVDLVSKVLFTSCSFVGRTGVHSL